MSKQTNILTADAPPDSLHSVVLNPVETFSDSQVESAIESFLEWGEQQYQKSQQGYFSGPGWAARCLRYHLEQLKARNQNDPSYTTGGVK